MVRVILVVDGRVVLDIVRVRRMFVPLMLGVGHVVDVVWLIVAAIVDSATFFVVEVSGTLVVVPLLVVVVAIAVFEVAIVRVVSPLVVAVVAVVVIMVIVMVIVVVIMMVIVMRLLA